MGSGVAEVREDEGGAKRLCFIGYCGSLGQCFCGFTGAHGVCSSCCKAVHNKKMINCPF